MITYRAVWIALLGWLLLVVLSRLTQGQPLVPPTVAPVTYWFIHIVIGLLIGACAHVVMRIIDTLKQTRK